MPSVQHANWSAAKKKLHPDTVKDLGKKKLDLGPRLDDFEKTATVLEKQLRSGDAKKAGPAMDALKKNREQINKAVTEYTKILETAKIRLRGVADNKFESQAQNNLQVSLRDVETRFKSLADMFSDTAQRIEVTLAVALGKDWVDALARFKFDKSTAYASLATNAAYTLVPAADSSDDDLTLVADAELVRLQKEFARQLKVSKESLVKLQQATRQKFSTRKDAIAHVQRTTQLFSDSLAPLDGAVGVFREWERALDAKTGKDSAYAASKEGKMARKVVGVISGEWQPHDETLCNLVSNRVQEKF